MSKFYYGQTHTFTSKDNSQGPNADKVYLRAGRGESLIIDGSISGGGGGTPLDLEKSGPIEYVDVSGTSDQDFSGATSTADYGTVVAISGDYAFTYDRDTSFSSRFDAFVKSGSSWSFDLAYGFTTCPPSSLDCMDMAGRFLMASNSGTGGYAAYLDTGTGNWGGAYQTGSSTSLRVTKIAIWTDGKVVGVDEDDDITELYTIEPDGANEYPSNPTTYVIDPISAVSINDNYIITGHQSLNKIVVRNRTTPTTEIVTINGNNDFGKFVFSNQSYIGASDGQTIYLYSNDATGTLITCFDTGLTLTHIRCSKTTDGNIVYSNGSSIRYIHKDPNTGLYIDNGSTRSLTKTHESLAVDEDFVLSGDSVTTSNGEITFRQNEYETVDPSNYSKIELTNTSIDLTTIGSINISNTNGNCSGNITIGPFNSDYADLKTIKTSTINGPVDFNQETTFNDNTIMSTADITTADITTGNITTVNSTTGNITTVTSTTGNITTANITTLNVSGPRFITNTPFFRAGANSILLTISPAVIVWGTIYQQNGPNAPTHSGGTITINENGYYIISYAINSGNMPLNTTTHVIGIYFDAGAALGQDTKYVNRIRTRASNTIAIPLNAGQTFTIRGFGLYPVGGPYVSDAGDLSSILTITKIG